LLLQTCFSCTFTWREIRTYIWFLPLEIYLGIWYLPIASIHTRDNDRCAFHGPMSLIIPFCFAEWIDSQRWWDPGTIYFRLARRGTRSEWGATSWRIMIENFEVFFVTFCNVACSNQILLPNDVLMQMYYNNDILH